MLNSAGDGNGTASLACSRRYDGTTSLSAFAPVNMLVRAWAGARIDLLMRWVAGALDVRATVPSSLARNGSLAFVQVRKGAQ